MKNILDSRGTESIFDIKIAGRFIVFLSDNINAPASQLKILIEYMFQQV